MIKKIEWNGKPQTKQISFSYLCVGVEKKILKEIYQFYPKRMSPSGGDNKIYNFISSTPNSCYIQLVAEL